MIAWSADLLVDLRGTREIDCTFARIARCARYLGFERCAYGLRSPLPFTDSPIAMVNDYDPRWQTRYRDAGHLRIDPTVTHALRSQSPLTWSDALFRSAPLLWDEARSFGLNVGWSQSRFDADGSVGMLSVVRSSEELTPAELWAKESELSLLAAIAHEALSVLLPIKPREAVQPLTRREVEVLRWTADGKTSRETADILGVSEATADFHVKNAVRKLGVTSRAAAAARAAVLGLLR